MSDSTPILCSMWHACNAQIYSSLYNSAPILVKTVPTLMKSIPFCTSDVRAWAQPESPSLGPACTGSGLSKFQAWPSTRAPARHQPALAWAPAYDYKDQSESVSMTNESQESITLSSHSPSPSSSNTLSFSLVTEVKRSWKIKS